MSKALRDLRIAFSATCLIACVLHIALWVRSFWHADRLHCPVGAKQSVVAASKLGSAFILFYENVPQPNAWQTGWYRHSVTAEESFLIGDLRGNAKLGFRRIQHPMYFIPELKVSSTTKPGVVTIWNAGTMVLNGDGLMIPFWFLTLTTVAIVAVPWIRYRFSIRTLLVATTLIAVMLGIIVWMARVG